MERIWFYVNVPDARASFTRHLDKIDALVPFWFGVTIEGGLLDQSDPEVEKMAKKHNIPILAIVHNYANPQLGAIIHDLLVNNFLRLRLIDSIARLLITRSFAGVNIDFEFVPPADRLYLNLFMSELYFRLVPRFLVTISAPAKVADDPHHPFSGAFSYTVLGQYSHQVFILAYDEHFTVPGPIASINFVRTVLNFALTEIPRHKIKLGMAVYGYDWVAEGGFPETLSHAEAVERARRFGAPIIYDENAQESTYTYVVDNIRHIVWFEDVRSFAVKLNLIRALGLPGFAAWRLGQEDPRIWELLSGS
ncbi:MAG: glycosyl hydrolase family 18 protein [Bacillota bacterium]|nr:glycosyl hydrolase family 18 protein [Bacillota bacterium]